MTVFTIKYTAEMKEASVAVDFKSDSKPTSPEEAFIFLNTTIHGAGDQFSFRASIEDIIELRDALNEFLLEAQGHVAVCRDRQGLDS